MIESDDNMTVKQLFGFGAKNPQMMLLQFLLSRLSSQRFEKEFGPTKSAPLHLVSVNMVRSSRFIIVWFLPFFVFPDTARKFWDIRANGELWATINRVAYQ